MDMTRLFVTLACCSQGASRTLRTPRIVTIGTGCSIARSNELMSRYERQDRACVGIAIVADEFMLDGHRLGGDTASTPRAEWIDNAVNLEQWEMWIRIRQRQGALVR